MSASVASAAAAIIRSAQLQKEKEKELEREKKKNAELLAALQQKQTQKEQTQKTAENDREAQHEKAQSGPIEEKAEEEKEEEDITIEQLSVSVREQLKNLISSGLCQKEEVSEKKVLRILFKMDGKEALDTLINFRRVEVAQRIKTFSSRSKVNRLVTFLTSSKEEIAAMITAIESAENNSVSNASIKPFRFQPRYSFVERKASEALCSDLDAIPSSKSAAKAPGNRDVPPEVDAEMEVESVSSRNQLSQLQNNNNNTAPSSLQLPPPPPPPPLTPASFGLEQSAEQYNNQIDPNLYSQQQYMQSYHQPNYDGYAQQQGYAAQQQNFPLHQQHLYPYTSLLPPPPHLQHQQQQNAPNFQESILNQPPQNAASQNWPHFGSSILPSPSPLHLQSILRPPPLFSIPPPHMSPFLLNSGPRSSILAPMPPQKNSVQNQNQNQRGRFANNSSQYRSSQQPNQGAILQSPLAGIPFATQPSA